MGIIIKLLWRKSGTITKTVIYSNYLAHYILLSYAHMHTLIHTPKMHWQLCQEGLVIFLRSKPGLSMQTDFLSWILSVLFIWPNGFFEDKGRGSPPWRVQIRRSGVGPGNLSFHEHCGWFHCKGGTRAAALNWGWGGGRGSRDVSPIPDQNARVMRVNTGNAWFGYHFHLNGAPAHTVA